MKILLLTISIFLTALAVHAQQPTSAASPATASVATIKSDDLLNLTTMERDHARRAARMSQIEKEYLQLEAAQKDTVALITAWINQQALELKVDLSKFRFDLETRKFVERPPEKKP